MEQRGYDVEQTEEFAVAVTELANTLLVDRHKVTFGPTYQTSTSQGEDLVIRTYQLPGDNANYTYLVAVDSTGKPVGFRAASLTQTNSGLQASGRVDVGKRGKGISTSLELAYFDYLQRTANQLQKPIRHSVVNINRINHELRVDAFNNKSAHGLRTGDSSVLIDELGKEQKRWDSQYGPEGQLGFDSSGQRTFYPTIDSVPLDTIDAIVLERDREVVDGRERVKPVATHIIPKHNPETTDKARAKFLDVQLLPSLRRMGMSAVLT